ncbi:hypothetical protein HYALB_00007158 [Hymenoscyphus albidus]|uniref:PH domain-containing protein n=1 Tax=Hymenoscyphus albidus TaxID=595503 RepID=A0A9N9Q256_9HELO|nr:hypothetical protein HYALB_00007158 [Hymenoscyphus albidus]
MSAPTPKMGTRSRVLSFMSSFANRDAQSPTPKAAPSSQAPSEPFPKYEPNRRDTAREPPTQAYDTDGSSSQPQSRTRERAPSRPMSMVQTYQPPLMDVNQDTLPELQPIFTFLNSHANKLYQEGYFLKLDDQNTRTDGKANTDRTWTECFAQLVGTVLSLWDAAELDAAGQDGEVLPKFINLTDASIKMIESLPTRSDNEAPLQNVLSISTAGRNRYLLHFNSHHSLVQWTAGIRLAMFEHATLQEAYTGALIAGKGKQVNNINVIMERARVKHEDWARVRFGAGTPWRRCWCVITPPDEKEVQKLQKQANKKRSAYDRSRPPVLKGDIKFYESKKTKKVKPIATITEAYSAYAIYPQSKPLIDASTLVKVEGSIMIHSNPPSMTEGFVFVMPEVHPAVSGFEMMLRWLFPAYDTFALYGRPGRLIPDTTDPNSLMFAMPKHRRYGYLEILDVSGLITEQGSGSWRESEWRRRMKELTKKRMTAIENGSQRNSRYGSRRSTRASFGPSRSRIQFDDAASVRSTPSTSYGQSDGAGIVGALPRVDSAPVQAGTFAPPPRMANPTHQRSVSETNGRDPYENQMSNSPYDGTYEQGPPPPPHNMPMAIGHPGSALRYQNEMATTPERVSSEDESAARETPVRELQDLQTTSTPEPVSAPPAFSHAPGALPITVPYHSPELRRAKSRMSTTTLSQLAGAGGAAATYNENGARDSEEQKRGYAEDQKGVPYNANNLKELNANQGGLNEGLVAPRNRRFSFENSSLQSDINNPQPPTQHSDNFTNPPLRNDSQAPPPPTHGNTRTYEPPSIFTTPNHTQGHNSQTSVGSTSTVSPHQPPRLQTSHSIVRKPLPSRTATLKDPSSVSDDDTPSSLKSLRNHVIDEAAFEMIGRDQRMQTLRSEYQIHRQNSGASVYDDGASTASPDYPSTRPSIDSKRSKKSVEKPRAGVKKTVGDPEFETFNNFRQSVHIDFGPTINYAAEEPPRKPSPGPNQSYNAGSPRGHSPGLGMDKHSSDRPRQQSPAARPDSAGVMNRNSVSPQQNANYRHSVAWQPGLAVATHPAANSQSITPEQFVAQKAAAAVATPMYAHQRQHSNLTLGRTTPTMMGRDTPTPPLVHNRPNDHLTKQSHSRNTSTDMLARPSDHLTKQSHSRNTSTDMLARPNSRTAGVALGPAVNPKLSAREQEHIARATGTPLINMAQNNRSSSGGGLVNAIENREHERQQLKHGMNSQAVQQAIAQRQQQQMYQQQYAEQQQQQQQQQMMQHRMSQQLNMNQYQQPQYPVQGQSPGWGMSPAANVFAQGGGWASPGYAQTPPGRQPSGQYLPHQQYFPPQSGHQGRGNNGGYRGH